MGEKWPVNFACDFDFHVNPGFFDMPRKSATWETALLPHQGRHAVDFFARKIRRLRPRSNPRSWVPEASMLTTRPPKPLEHLYSNGKKKPCNVIGCVFTESMLTIYCMFMILYVVGYAFRFWSVSAVWKQCKTIPIQTWRGPEVFRTLMFPDFNTIDTRRR